MPNPFFDYPIVNFPYTRPARHWELDESDQPTQPVIESPGWAFAEFTDVFQMQE